MYRKRLAKNDGTIAMDVRANVDLRCSRENRERDAAARADALHTKRDDSYPGFPFP